MEERYPNAESRYDDNQAILDVNLLQSIIKDVRNYKVMHQLAPNSQLTLIISAKKDSFISEYRPYLERFTFSIIETKAKPEQLIDNAPYVYPSAELVIIESVNKIDALAKLSQDIEKEQYVIARALKWLDNPSFRDKAPSSKIAEEEEKLATHRATLKALQTKRALLEN